MANLSRFGGVPRSSIYLSEQAAAQADVAAYGQFWTKNATPNTPYFTDDAGNDRALVWVESGTFTPTIQDTSLSDAESQTYAQQNGKYRKVGDVVHVWIDVEITSIGTLTGTDAAVISGLPYAKAAGSTGAFFVTYGASLAVTARDYVVGIMSAGNTRIDLLNWNATAGPANLTITQISAGGRLVLHGSYIAA